MRQIIFPLISLLLVSVVSACASVPPAGSQPQAGLTVANAGNVQQPGPEPTEEMMEHGNMHGKEEVPFDATFIDGMIEHHNGAIKMAEEAMEKSERPEVLTLAEAIVAAQTTEIDEMQSWRNAWFPDLEATMGMEMNMGDMSVSSDESIPFDQRFLQAMISHHEGAVDMAEEALMASERMEIRTLSETIIATQTAEIEQMRAWLADWYAVTG